MQLLEFGWAILDAYCFGVCVVNFTHAWIKKCKKERTTSRDNTNMDITESVLELVRRRVLCVFEMHSIVQTCVHKLLMLRVSYEHWGYFPSDLTRLIFGETFMYVFFDRS